MSVEIESGESSAPRLSSLLAPHLPFLRRYGRALCGSQSSGDAYVASALETVIADRSAIDLSLSPRVALYKLFQEIWMNAQVDGSAPDREVGAEEESSPLARLTPRSRQALLLHTVEEFSPHETASILGISTDETEGLIATARGELEAQLRSRVMIIEDEPVIALDIESIVRELGHEVTGVADTHATAVALASETQPDLVLADIQLADGSSGVEAVEEILNEIDVPVIFITAYPERLLTGERPEPTYLVTKPFRPETVETAISQALFFARRQAAQRPN